jgi:hypothetical protein
LGEAATLLGWVIPSTRDETVPLISNTQEDYEVVHSLLTEHYAAFETDAYEDDDDTDPRQKDFLFGALLREIGVFLRRENLLGTLQLAYGQLAPRTKNFQRVSDWLSDLFLRVFSRAPAFVADAYAALNFGRDHLIQYYAYLRSQDEKPLTARADAPQLYRVSRDLLEMLGNEPPSGKDKQLFRATLRNRLVSLSRFFYTPVAEEHARVFRIGAAVLVAAAVAMVMGLTVTRSLDYHSVYLERMQQMRERLAETHAGGADGGTP